MYAIIEDSGQQFKVSEGDVMNVDLRDLAEGAESIEFDRVLLVADGEKVHVGTPLVSGAKVVAEVVGAKVAGPKLRVFKYKRRKGYHRNIGHRQKYTQVRITRIVA
ncbi:MAG TPA: 50S ribosomal protein L21 [Phycisphaerae bacterium]|nr:50S ribosomal protein L21 [Phycisphaerae bacterium]